MMENLDSPFRAARVSKRAGYIIRYPLPHGRGSERYDNRLESWTLMC